MSAAEDFERVAEALRTVGSLGMNAGSPHALRNDRKALDEEQAEGMAALERIRAALARSVERLRASYREGECYGRDGPEDYANDCSTLRPGDPCITCLAKEVMETLS